MSMEVVVALIVVLVVISQLWWRYRQRKKEDQILSQPMVPVAYAPPPAVKTERRRSRAHLRLVNARFTVPPAQQAISRKEFILPELPPEREAVVRAYLQAGVGLGFALEALQRGTAVHPAVVSRFEDAEAAYAGLGYRTVTPASFRALATSDVPLPEREQPCTPRNEGEQPSLCAGYVRAHIRQQRVHKRK